MILWVSAPMNFDIPIRPSETKLGDIVWMFDIAFDMNVPVKVTKLYEDGTWDGMPAWTWGWA